MTDEEVVGRAMKALAEEDEIAMRQLFEALPPMRAAKLAIWTWTVARVTGDGGAPRAFARMIVRLAEEVTQ